MLYPVACAALMCTSIWLSIEIADRSTRATYMLYLRHDLYTARMSMYVHIRNCI